MQNISLIGFRGTGKTSLGKLLAQELDMNFLDIDSLIETNTDTKIEEIFAELGEKVFRKIEASIVRDVMQNKSNCVISHGGGVALNNNNIQLIKSHSVVLLLNTSHEVIYDRIKDSNRPKLTDLALQKEIITLLAQRMPLYKKCGDIQIDLEDHSEEESVKLIKEKLKKLVDPFLTHRISYQSKQLKSYDIMIQRGSFGNVAEYIQTGNRYIIITDTNVGKLYASSLQEQLRKSGRECSIVSFPAGEAHKTLSTFENLHEKINLQLDRKSCIITLGGGVVGDMGGFVAATYMRGIPFIQVPTSLLAMVDSSVGGKLGVNTSIGKNCVGLFCNPQRVIIDPLLLYTLPNENFKDGLVEVIKHALISDQNLFDFLIKHKDELFLLDTDILLKIIKESIEIKIGIVKDDEIEKGNRELLNFGHTVGHALESLSNFTLSHGNGVAVGIVVNAYISWLKGFLDIKTVDQIKSNLIALNLPTSLRDLDIKLDIDKIIQLMQYDKKTLDNRIKFVLLKAIGQPIITDRVHNKEIMEALEFASQ